MNWSEIPKTELHLHLEGAAPPAFIRMLAAEKNINLSGVFDENGAYQWADFLAFLKTYEAACSVLQSPEDFKRLVKAVLAQSSRHGVIYTEMFLAADFCGGGDLGAWREYLAAMSEGAAESQKMHGIETRFISTCVRHMGADQARVVSSITAETAGGLLTGFGMGGDENFGNPADYVYAFDQAREAGLGLTSHAGEVAGPQSVIDTLDHLKVSRIGHGVRAIEDADLVHRLAVENITLEVNPGSNIALSVYPDLKSHPVTTLRDAGVEVTISTDDPPYFHTDMTAEYAGLSQDHGWDMAAFNSSNRIAMKAAFCDEGTRETLLARFKDD